MPRQDRHVGCDAKGHTEPEPFAEGRLQEIAHWQLLLPQSGRDVRDEAIFQISANAGSGQRMIDRKAVMTEQPEAPDT